MYKILIVDDEYIVREGISSIINWKLLGYELVGKAEDGQEAITLIKKYSPDLILTDICMPFIDGLMLTEYIIKNHPSIKVLIFSGHDDFSYAQKAIKLNVIDYLLKPITANELSTILQKTKEKLDQEKHEQHHLSQLKTQLNENLPLVKEKFINNLLSNQISNDDIKKNIHYFDDFFQKSFFEIIIIDADDSNKYANNDLYLVIKQVIAPHTNAMSLKTLNNNTVIILSGPGIPYINKESELIYEKCNSAITEGLTFTVSFAIGSIVTSIENITKSYEAALMALSQRFYIGNNKVIRIDEINQQATYYVFDVNKWKRKISLSIKSGILENINNILDDIINELKNIHSSKDLCFIWLQQIIVHLFSGLNQLKIAEKSQLTPMSLEEIYEYKNIDNINNWLKNRLDKVSKQISSQKTGSQELQVLKAEEYINENYYNKDLSLNEICGFLSLSTSYFSLLFKNKTKKTFIQYLTEIRINKACELLKETNYKKYKIADIVGYQDPHYFSAIFKKYISMTPTEYRNNVRRDSKL